VSPASASAWRARLLAHGPWLSLTAVGLWLLWPVPLGRMPLSADHTVHLARIWMFADTLAGGHVRGWSDAWFLGTPVGELYPVLGDLLVIAVRVLSAGLLDWHQSYAIGFSIAFLVPAYAMLRVGRTLGLGAAPGLVAGLLVLCDAGAYREGGWIYTVGYGVWPQHLATGLSWLGLAELAVAATEDDASKVRRHLGTAALAIGGAILAHPMALPSIAIGAPLLVLVVGLRPWRRLPRVAAIAGLGTALGLLVAAWFLVPMLAHRGWMASYGWTFMPLSRLAHEAMEGRFAQHMPTAVGAAIALGLLLQAVRGSARGRFLGALALLLWILSSEDVLWELRLDRLSAGFLHIQYQRFMEAAKPGLFLAAGAAIGMLLAAARQALARGLPTPATARPVAVAIAGVAVSLCAWMVVGQRASMREHEVGVVQLHRMPRPSSLDSDYPALVAWLKAQWDDRGDAFYRMTVVAPRNLHWFMDAPVLTGMPLYKQGFTPGDNFVHKPESGKDAVLDRARVRYVVVPQGRGGRGKEVASFGELRVLERTGWDALPIAWLEGPGEVQVLDAEPDGGPIRLRVSGTGGASRLVFAIAGHPRWELTQDGAPIAWVEAPIWGDGPDATLEARRGGELRGGKALGDDGTEPTLIAADVGDGEVILRYRARTARDVIAGLVSVLALGACLGLAFATRRWPGATTIVQRSVDRVALVMHPAVLGAVLVLAGGIAGMRWRDAAVEDAGLAVGRVLEGRAKVSGAHAGLVKSDMLIRPAVIVNRRRKGPAVVELPGVVLGPALHGWLAVDDDAAQMKRRGSHQIRSLLRTEAGEHVLMPARPVAHRPGRVPIELDTQAYAGQTGTIVVIVDSEGEAPPPLGFDLELEPGEDT
jgi:hypothetical protein